MAVYARYEGIKGESTDKRHADWIEIAGYHWGAGGSRGDSSPFTLTFGYDRAAPHLLEAAHRGITIPKLQVDVVSAGENPISFLHFAFEGVGVIDVEIEGEQTSVRPLVITVNTFRRVAVTYTLRGADGSAEEVVETGWDVGQPKAKKGKKK
jgi:type VI secretion system secreted protein Hcp